MERIPSRCPASWDRRPPFRRLRQTRFGPRSPGRSASAGKPAWIPSEELGVVLLRILPGMYDRVLPWGTLNHSGSIATEVFKGDTEGSQCGRYSDPQNLKAFLQ